MDKIELNTFIIKDKNYIIKDVNNIDTNYFVSITNIMDIDSKKIKVDHIDGVILMNFNDEIIMDYSYWDDVQDLWHYFINAFEELLFNKETKFSFPSQPLPVSFKIEKNRLYLRIAEKQINTEAKYFINSMCIEAINFFESLIKLFPRLEFEYSLNVKRISLIIKKIDEKF